MVLTWPMIWGRFFLPVLGVVFLGLVSAAPSRAAAPRCAPYQKPITLGFKTLAPKAIYNNRLTVDGIRNTFREHTDPVLGPHERALGITYAQSSYGAEARSKAATVPGGYCVYLTELDVEFGFKHLDVYIAREFEPGTCEYRSVLDHENQHVSINNGTLKAFAPQFRAQVEKILTLQQPVFTTNAEAGMDTALKTVESNMSALLVQFQRAMAERNAPLDSRSNYAATSKLCANWNGTSAPGS